MAESDHEQIAERLEHESDALERDVRELGDDIDRVKADWRSKRADPQIPGAAPPEEPGEEQAPPR